MIYIFIKIDRIYVAAAVERTAVGSAYAHVQRMRLITRILTRLNIIFSIY